MVDIAKCLEMLKPSMRINMEGIHIKTVSSLINPQTGQIEHTQLPDWQDRIPKKDLRDTDELLHALDDGKDSINLTELTENVWCCLNGRGRCDLTKMLADVFMAPYALGIVLRNSWTDGNHGSILQWYKKDLERWFRKAAVETLMTDEERAVLASLPDPTHAYRGAPSSKGRSWTLNRTVAQAFVERGNQRGVFGAQSGKVFEADIPRTQILAYFNVRKEEEIIVSPNNGNASNIVSRRRRTKPMAYSISA